MWKIGNHKTTHARRNGWIPSLANGKITSTVAYESNVFVKDLLLPQKVWDIPKLEELFLHYEVEAIKKTPIAKSNAKDAHYQKFEKKGGYIVKSGYWKGSINVPNQIAEEGSSSHDSSQAWWTKIWKLRVPPKVKIFICKSTLDIIATEANLKAHHVPCTPRCFLCGYY